MYFAILIVKVIIDTVLLEHTTVSGPQYLCTAIGSVPWWLLLFVKLEELHIATARKPLFHQTQPVACYWTQKSAMHVVVYADRLTTQHSIVDIVHWSWSYWQFCYPRWHVECFWAALAAHWISSASHTSVLPQHPRRKIVPYRVGWNHHTSDYCG